MQLLKGGYNALIETGHLCMRRVPCLGSCISFPGARACVHAPLWALVCLCAPLLCVCVLTCPVRLFVRLSVWLAVSASGVSRSPPLPTPLRYRFAYFDYRFSNEVDLV